MLTHAYFLFLHHSIALNSFSYFCNNPTFSFFVSCYAKYTNLCGEGHHYTVVHCSFKFQTSMCRCIFRNLLSDFFVFPLQFSDFFLFSNCKGKKILHSIWISECTFQEEENYATYIYVNLPRENFSIVKYWPCRWGHLKALNMLETMLLCWIKWMQ